MDLTTPIPLPVEEQFGLLADSAPVMIWIAGTDKKFYYFNAGWLRFCGKTFAEVIGDGWLRCMHPADREKYNSVFLSAFNARKEFKTEYRLKRYDQEYRWILDTGVPRYTEDGRFAGYIGSSVDIQDIKNIEQKRQEFINVASHELKTPLTSLKLYLELLRKQTSKNEANSYNHFFDKISNQVEKLTELVKNLLDITKLESGKLQLHVELFDITQCLYEVIADYQETLESHHIQISGNDRVSVRGDKERIAQVIQNLLSNAVKFSPKSDKILVELKTEERNVHITIADYGIGIEKEHLEKIFERFFRINELNGQTFPGLGIGLYFSSEIINQHQGKIWAESKKRKGTTIHIILPAVAI